MKQTISSRKASQARVQTRVQRKCFTQACNEQSCKLSTPVSIRELRRFSRRSKKARSEEHTSELQSQFHLVCRLLLEKKKIINDIIPLRHINYNVIIPENYF